MCSFEKVGNGIFIFITTKVKITARIINAPVVYNAETGNMDYKLMVDTLDTCQRATDRIEFADNYYMVTTFGSAGSEPASFITNMKLYSYDGEMLASSHNDSYLGGDYLG